MRFVYKLVLFSAVASLPTLRLAAEETPVLASVDEIARAKNQLTGIMAALKELGPTVAQRKKPQLRFLSDTAEKVLKLISTRGIGNAETLRRRHQLVIRFTIHHRFFDRCLTEANASFIGQIQTLATSIRDDLGFDGSPYMRVTEDLYGEMRGLLTKLLELPIDAEFKAQAQAIQQELLIDVLPIAAQGDRRLGVEAGMKIYPKIVALYPKLEELKRSEGGFEIADSIEALNGAFAEFAQLDTE